MSNNNYQKPEFTREHRLGLVVYGGVALAIYMNGVCREFYNAMRGRGIYKLVKALTDSDIVVDIISGTSAGGINGVLLSYALTNSSETEVVDFDNFARVWRDSGDIRQLIRQPNETLNSQSKEDKHQSILDGENVYQEALLTAFKEAQANKKSAPTDEWLSTHSELDLFVTGTDVLGKIYQVFDQTGSVIEVKNHRTVFHLKHRQGRKSPFNPDFNPAVPKLTNTETYEALSKLCRITSCFPVAFPVVTVEIKNPYDRVDSLLERWGSLSDRDLPETPPKYGYRLHFIDGGVLDNRPFSYTIKEMYYRTANRPVDRKLFYIDPSPDRFTKSEDFKEMAQPEIGQIIQDAVIGLPMYESIANDLEFIKERNQKVSRYKVLLSNVENVEALDDSNNPGSKKNDVQEGIYLRSRMINLRDRILPLILRMQQNWVTDYSKKKILEKTANLLTERITDNSRREDTEKLLQSFGQRIRNLDVEYALRKHFYILQKICQKLEQETRDSEYQKLKELSGKVARQIKLLEVIRAALDQLMSNVEISNSFAELLKSHPLNSELSDKLYDRLVRLHCYLLDPTGLEKLRPTPDKSELDLIEIPADFFIKLPLFAAASNSPNWLPQNEISSVFEQLKHKITQISSPDYIEQNIWSEKRYVYDHKENTSLSPILLQVELATAALIKNSKISDFEDILKRFNNFRQVDQVLYPFESLSDIGEKEIIQTVRISPNDAQMGLGNGKYLEEKLAGDSLYAFGGFFKKSWRSNDILWGRLDGLNRIVEALITKKTIKNFSKFIQREAKGGNENYIEFLLDECLPKETSDRVREKMKISLTNFAQPNYKIGDEELQDFIETLVLEGHRAILNTDLQNVIEDAVEEQITWNLRGVKPENYPQVLDSIPEPNYNLGGRFFDRTVTTLAAAKIAKEAINSFPQGKEYFFRNEYKIGKESLLTDVPRILLVNLATRSVLVLRNIIKSTLKPELTTKISRQPIYQFFNKSLQLFYWWLQYRGPSALESFSFNRGRPIILILQVALLVVAIAGVAITVSQSWVWIAIALGATVLFWLIGLLRKSA